MILKHYSWTLLLCNVLICSIYGIQKVRSYKAVRYQSALGRLWHPLHLRPRSRAHSSGPQHRDSIKGGGSPYISPESHSTYDQREDVQRHTSTVLGTPVPREQVKLMPVFHGRPGLGVAQSSMIQFGSAQSESASRVFNRLLGGFTSSPGWLSPGSASGHGHAHAHAHAQRGLNQSLATSNVFSPHPSSQRNHASSPVTFGSGQNTGMSFGSRDNTAGSFPRIISFVPEGSVRNPTTGHFTSGGSTLRKPTSVQYTNANAAPFSAQRISHRPTPSSSLASLGTRYSVTHRYTQRSNLTSRANQTVPNRSDSRAGSLVIGHQNFTQERKVPFGSHVVRPPIRFVQFMPQTAAPSPSWGSPSRFGTVVVTPGMGSTGHRQHYSQYGSSMPAEGGPDPAYTRKPISGNAERTHGCVERGC
ncbi:uncharacterized protein LOC133111973 [Conger conger]|uniref:uncharacterized protein LOC133111973 n=1 Tax=Conger conger TaxID=82655 RepID=UPI002A59A25A|nr:uncharacterized protein LOC133111973 [Conger conger]